MKSKVILKLRTAKICSEKVRNNPDLLLGKSYEVKEIDKGLRLRMNYDRMGHLYIKEK